MRILAALLIYLAAINASQACSPGAGPPRWDREVRIAGDRLRRIPSPPRLIASSLLLHRPPIATVAACDDFARFVIRVQLEPGSTADLSDYGYVFRLRSKNADPIFFTNQPLRADVVNGVAEFRIEVMDLGSSKLSPIDLDVEVRAADRANRLGPKSRFRLRAEVNNGSDGA